MGAEENRIKVFTISLLSLVLLSGIGFALPSAFADAPLVTDVTVTLTAITDANANLVSAAEIDGDEALEVKVTFNETMDDTIPPTFAFITPAPAGTTFTFDGPNSSWDVTDTIFTAKFDVVDNGEEVADIDVKVTSAKDSSGGNTQVEYTEADQIGIDTKNPKLATATLTISSDNADTTLATNTNIITIILTASEPLSPPQVGDFNIQGTGDVDADVALTDGTPGDAIIQGTLTVDTDDTEGVANFDITFRDLAGNLGDPDQNTPNVPEVATHLLTTDDSEVIIDHSAPNVTASLEIVGTTDAGDTDNLRTTLRDVQLIFDCDDSNALAIDETGALDSSKVSGCVEAKVSFDGEAANFNAFADILAATTNDVELSPERGEKTVLSQYRDAAGNSDDTDSRSSDTINLDSYFRNVDVNGASNETGEWEDHDFAINGEIVHPKFTDEPTRDQVNVTFDYLVDNGLSTFDWPEGFYFPDGFPSQIQIVTIEPIDVPGNDDDPADGLDTYKFTASSQYPRPSMNQLNNVDHIQTPEVTLVDSLDAQVSESFPEISPPEVDENPVNNHEILERPTLAALDFIPNQYAGNMFSVTGTLTDQLDPFNPILIPNKVIEFFGTGAETTLGDDDILADSLTSQGVEINDDDEIEIDLVGSDYVAHFKADSGAMILTTQEPGNVLLTAINLQFKQVNFKITDANGEVKFDDFTGADNNPVSLPLNDVEGIVSVEILKIFDTSGFEPVDEFTVPPAPTEIEDAILDIINIRTVGKELEPLDDITFDTAETVTSKFFNFGGFLSEGETPEEGTGYLVDSQFTDETDPDYLPSPSSVRTFESYFTTHSGLGGSAAVVEDGGKGIASILCLSTDDNEPDGPDAICDSWETGGIPYVIGGVVYYWPIPGADVNQRDVYIEIDYMEDHLPDPQSLTLVEDEFLNNGNIDLHINVDEQYGLHRDTINLWVDALLDDESDFNDIKRNHFGTPSIYSVINGPTTQSNVITGSGTSYDLTISGLTVETPVDPISGNKSKGQIVYKVRLLTDAATTITAGTPSGISGGGFWTLTPKVTAIQSTGSPTTQIITITADYASIFAWGNDGIHAAKALTPIVIPLTVDSGISFVDADGGTAGIQQLTQAGSPYITSTLENAYAQVYRYFIWAHSFGGPSGQAEFIGNDAIITLGEGFKLADDGHAGGSEEQQAGTFAHELGHLLGLNHGGPAKAISSPGITFADSTVNCKPNYPSVMSYSRQIDNYLTTWAPNFSDGSHGGSPLDPIAQNSPFGTPSASGLIETALLDTRVLPGTGVTIVIGTPDSTNGNTFVEATSNVSPIDWKDNGVSSVSADINNFGISGCLASGPSSTATYDYDDFANMDFNYRAGTSGQFDGVTIFISDVNGNVGWQTVLLDGDFDGVQGNMEDGTKESKIGSNVPIEITLEDQNGDPIELTTSARGHVFVSKNPDAIGLHDDPRKGWVQIENNNPVGDPLEMVWDDEVLYLDWKSPKSSRDFDNGNFKVDGEWFIRIVLYDPENTDDNPDRPLAGIPGDPDSDFLMDLVPPFLPDGENLKATAKVILSKAGPGADPSPDDPPPLPDDSIDLLIGEIDNLVSKGDLSKGPSKKLTGVLNTAKDQFGGGFDAEGCASLDQFISDVDGLKSTSQTTKDILIDGVPAAGLDLEIFGAEDIKVEHSCPP